MLVFGGGYAQAGYHEGASQGTGIQYFAEYNDGSCPAVSCTDDHFKFVVENGWSWPGTKQYKVDYVTGSPWGRLDMLVGSNHLLSTPWDPQDLEAPQALWTSQLFAEAHDAGDDIPGWPLDHLVVDNIKVKAGAVGPWESQSQMTPASTLPSVFHAQLNALCSCALDVWTERLPGQET